MRELTKTPMELIKTEEKQLTEVFEKLGLSKYKETILTQYFFYFLHKFLFACERILNELCGLVSINIMINILLFSYIFKYILKYCIRLMHKFVAFLNKIYLFLY